MGFELSMWRAVAVFRVASLGYAAAVVVANDLRYAHPLLGWAALAVMGVWTAVVTIASPAVRPESVGARRDAGFRDRWMMLSLDLAFGVALVLATRAVETHDRVTAGAQTLSVTWSVAPVLAWAATSGPIGGAAAGLAIGVADAFERGDLTQSVLQNSMYVLIAGTVVGCLASLGRRAEQTLAHAIEVQASTAERERLARSIHDSVLQVLALVQRRGHEIGGEAAELATLAGEQEAALRALVGAPPHQRIAGAPIDLRELLASAASARVSVSTPATPVLLPEYDAEELAAAVLAALDNVASHAGPQAKAWVLLEDEGDRVVVSVRDDGVGFDAGRLDEAEASGRLGVSLSIRGRIRDLGGETMLTSAPGEGTELELVVPRRGEQGGAWQHDRLPTRAALAAPNSNGDVNKR